jgi:tetratricopeptide (TPR) repeat protein
MRCEETYDSTGHPRSAMTIPEEFRELFETFRATQLPGGCSIHLERELTDGLSGAFVCVIDISASAETSADLVQPGAYILKLGRTSKRRSSKSEMESHAAAYAWSTDFAKQHMLELVRAHGFGEFEALLYEVAGASLASVTSAVTVGATSLEQTMRSVSRAILVDLPQVATTTPATPRSLLSEWLGHRLDPSKAPVLRQTSAAHAGIGPKYIVNDQVLASPLWFASSDLAAQEPSISSQRGSLHGDLHLRNIIVSRAGNDANRFWLIDFALSKAGPLFYDHAYLEMSLLLHYLQATTKERLCGLLRALDLQGKREQRETLPVQDVGLLDCLQAVRSEVIAWQEEVQPRRHDSVQAQVKLARIAVGLNWANKQIADADREKALIYAGWATRDYLTMFNAEGWQSIMEAESSVVSTTATELRTDTFTKEPWSALWKRLAGFDPSAGKFVLIGGGNGTNENFISLGMLPWSAVLDFDNDSDRNGLFATIGAPLSKRRALIRFGREPLAVNLDNGTAWLMANGWEKIDEPSPPNIREWRRVYLPHMRRISELLSSASSPQQVHVVVLTSDLVSGEMLARTLEALDESLGDRCLITILGSASAPDTGIEANRYAITPLEFGAKIREIFGASDESEAFLIPGLDGMRAIPLDALRNMEQDLQILHNRLLIDGSEEQSREAFWRGSPPSWYDIQACADVIRTIHPELVAAVEDELKERRNVTIELRHAPGAGGTTVAMRLAWELKSRYPVAILRRASLLTLDRLRELSQLSGMPVLLVIDSALLGSVHREELFHGLRAHHTRVVILHIIRTIAKDVNRSLSVPDPMSRKEAEAFFSSLSNRPELAYPGEKINLLQSIIRAADSSYLARYRSPFFLGLITYDREFTRVDRYVEEYLREMPAHSRSPMLYLALVSRFSQLDLHISLMSGLLQVYQDQGYIVPVEGATITDALGPAMQLIVQRRDEIKLLHPMIAEEVLRQLLGKPSAEPWSNDLADICIQFIDDLITVAGAPSDKVHDLLVGIFIYRDTWSTSAGEVRNFSEVIEAIGDSSNQHRVLTKLTEVLPSESHFWNHLGRHYIYKLKRDFETAEQYLLKATALEPKEAYHHHSLGMVRRFWIADRIQMLWANPESPSKRRIRPTAEAILSDVDKLAEDAASDFATTRELSASDDHGYITHIQLILTVTESLVKAAGVSGAGSLCLDSGPVSRWLQRNLIVAEDLLAQVQHNRTEGRPSNYEIACVSGLESAWGNFKEIIRRWEEEVSQGRDNSLIRRVLATAYIARRKHDWNGLHQGELKRIVELMEANLREDPNNARDIRTWFEAYHRLPSFSYLDALGRLENWAKRQAAQDAYFFIYILHFLLLLEGVERNADEVKRALDSCRKVAVGRTSYSYQWLAVEPKSCPIVYFRELGEWDSTLKFYPKSRLLHRISGTVKDILSPQAGRIRLKGGLDAFFVPGVEFFASKDINCEVEFFLGFSYEGFRAWSVRKSQVNEDIQEEERLPSVDGPSFDSHSEAEVVTLELFLEFIRRTLEQMAAHPPKLKDLEQIVAMRFPDLKIDGFAVVDVRQLISNAPDISVNGGRVYLV